MALSASLDVSVTVEQEARQGTSKTIAKTKPMIVTLFIVNPLSFFIYAYTTRLKKERFTGFIQDYFSLSGAPAHSALIVIGAASPARFN